MNHDVDYSLLLSGLTQPCYDSPDGYEWHSRESALKAVNAHLATGAACPDTDESGAFVVAATLASMGGEDEYWGQITDEVVTLPYSSASKDLKKSVIAVRKVGEKAERAKKEAAEQAPAARRREIARKRASRSSFNDYSVSGSSSIGGGNAGYKGPRCYAPGGQTWKPC